jgi:AcrR family transcriptional regulator
VPKNRQQIPRAQREREILDHARALFVERGYRGTSVAALAKAIGIASAAVHWYFPTKDDLLATLWESIFTEARTTVEKNPEISGDPRAEMLEFLVITKPFRRLHREVYERTEESDSVRAIHVEMQDWLEQRLLAAVASGVPAEADVAAVADLAHVLFEGMLVSVRRLDRSLEELVDLLIHALVAAATAAPIPNCRGQDL